MTRARVMLAAAAALASILASPRPSHGSSVVWEQQAVRYPVAPAELTAAPPYVPASVPELRGAVEVGPDRAAALYLEAAAVVRARVIGAPVDRLRMGRVIGDGPGRVLIDEPGTTTSTGEDGALYLVQPPASGDLWFVTADTPVRVVIERPAYRSGRLLWEEVHDQVLAWIEHGGPMPELPVAPGSEEVEIALHADEAIEYALHRTYPSSIELRRAITAWRKASALMALCTIRPVLGPFLVRERVDDRWPGAEVSLRRGRDASAQVVSREPYRLLRDARATYELVLDGPGVLHVEARALLEPSALDDPSGAPAAEGSVAPRRAAAGTVDDLAVDIGVVDATLGSAHGPAAPALHSPGPAWQHAVPDERLLYAGDHLVSLEREVIIPLLHGTHTYRVTVTGGPAIVRASLIRRRPRLREALGSIADPGDFVVRARESLARARDAAPALALARALLAELDTPLAAAPAETAHLPPLLRLVALRGQARSRRHASAEALAADIDQLLAALPDAASEGETLLIWDLRRRFAHALARWHGPVRAQAVLGHAGRMADEAPLAIAGTVAELIAETPGPVPSRALRAAEDAWRDRPAHPDRRRHYLSVWHRNTQWSLLAPARPDDGGAPRLAEPPWTWIDGGAGITRCTPEEPLGRAARRGSMDALYLPLGTTCWVEVPAMAADPGRLARLRVHVFTADHAPGPISVRIGQRSAATLAFERQETLEFAVAPGTYPVRVDGPAGTIVLIERPSGVDTLVRAGTPLRRRWPVHGPDRAPLLYALPRGVSGSAVRVELREVVNHTAPGEPITLRLRADTGWQVALRFTPAARDPALVPLDAPGGLTAATRVTVWVPGGAQHLWLESDSDRPIVAAVAIRRPSDVADERLREHLAEAELDDDDAVRASVEPVAPLPAPPPCPAQPYELPPLIARLYALSRCLVAEPQRAAWRLERADLLLDLGRVAEARADLDALASLPAAEVLALSAEREAVRTRVRDARRISYLRPQPQPALFSAPTPLLPALLALGAPPERLQAFVPLVQTARRDGAERALEGLAAPAPGDALAVAVHARLHRLAGRHEAAARMLLDAFLAADTWQLGLGALAAFNDALAGGAPSPDRMLAPLAHGLASRLATRIEHAEIRRALALSGARSAREPVRGVDGHAGFERLYLDKARLEPEPADLAPWAYLAPPWPEDESRMVAPGQAARIDLTIAQPASVWVEAWCRTRQNEPYPCRVTMRVDQRKHATAQASRGRVPLSLPPARLLPGVHTIEAVHAEDGDVLVSVRFMADRALGAPRRQSGRGVPIAFLGPSRAFAARPGAPITLTVATPLALWVDVRTRADAPAPSATITATPLAGGPAIHETVILDPAPDPAISGDPGRGIQVGRAAEAVLLVPGTGPHLVTVSVPAGMALARFASRRALDPAHETADPAPGPAFASSWREPPRVLDQPALPRLHAQAPPGLPGARLTYSLEVGMGQDDFGAGDTPESGALRLDMTLLARRRVRPGALWLGADVWLRSRPEDEPAAGVRLGAHARRLPLSLRAELWAEAASQRIAGAISTSARARLLIDRSIGLGPSLFAIPALGVELTSPGAAPPAGEAADPRVTSAWTRTHERGLTGRASLTWLPFQDQLGLASLEARSNADLVSVDHMAARLAWRGLVEIEPRTGPVLELAYRLSYRLEDTHRDAGYLRHDPSLRLEWPLWRGTDGRLVLDLGLHSYLAAGRQEQHLFRVGVRYDWTRGRGLMDFFPREIDLDDFQDNRPWSPPR